MSKKIIAALLCVCLLCTVCLSLFGCNKDEPEAAPLRIVYLGDSIAEGVAGPAPIQERINYSYYGILGQINGYEYHNRSVSGYETSNLLDYINRPDTDAYISSTLIKQADIIHVSILGNDLLRYDFSSMVLDVANGQTNDLMEECLERATVNFAKIVEKLKEMNPDATLIFQNVYNPIHQDAELLTDELKEAFADTEYKTGAQWRALVHEKIIGRLDKIEDDYLAAHPGAFHIVDTLTGFDNIYKEDEARGKSLIYCDGVHPSDAGHAVIAALNQDLLVKLGLADAAKGLANYKTLLCGMLDRMYDGTKKDAASFDTAAAKAAINSAENMLDAAKAYFAAINGYTPKLYSNTTSLRTNGKAVAETQTYHLSGLTIGMLGTVNMAGVLNSEKTTCVLNPDGTYKLTLTVELGSLLSAVGSAGIDLNLDGMDLSGYLMGRLRPADFVQLYMLNMFPGTSYDDIAGTIGIVTESMGLDVTGLDPFFVGAYEEYPSYVDFLLNYILENDELPDGITDKINECGEVSISYTGVYSLTTVTSADGTTYDAVYVGQYYENTSPWFIMTRYVGKDGYSHIKGSLDILGVNITF